MDQNRLQNNLERIPDNLKGWIGLIIAIAGIAIAFRSQRQLYSVIIIGTILAIWLFVGIYIVRARSKRGLYLYDNFRWAGFLSIGAVIGIIFAFSLFTPNRLYVYEAFVGTSTLTPSPTPTLTPSPTLTPTLTLEPVLTPPVTTEPLQPTLIPDKIFQDDFTYNKQGWDPNHSLVSLGNPTFYGDVTNGELKYTAACSEGGNPCISYFNIPRVQERDFDLQFDATLTKCVDSTSPCVIFVRFRDANNQFYVIKFFNTGLVTMYRNDGRQIGEREFLPQLDQGNGPNHFRIIAHDATFKIYAGKKGEEVTVPIEFTDGNNSFIGAVSLGVELKDGHVAIVIFDNVLIQEVQ